MADSQMTLLGGAILSLLSLCSYLAHKAFKLGRKSPSWDNGLYVQETQQNGKTLSRKISQQEYIQYLEERVEQIQKGHAGKLENLEAEITTLTAAVTNVRTSCARNEGSLREMRKQIERLMSRLPSGAS